MLVVNLPARQDSAAARCGIFYRCKTYSSPQNTSSGIAIISHSKVKIFGILDAKQVSLISDNQPTIFSRWKVLYVDMKEEFGKCGFLSSQDHMQTHQSFPFHGGKSLSLSPGAEFFVHFPGKIT